jgi:hypothetical protein
MGHMQAAWDIVLEQHEARAAAGRERAERDLQWQHHQLVDVAARLHGDIADDLEDVTVRTHCCCPVLLGL